MLRNKMAAPPLLSHFPISTWPYPRGRGSNERANRKLENGFGPSENFLQMERNFGTCRNRSIQTLCGSLNELSRQRAQPVICTII